jgi:hypothetical protein
MADHQTLTDAIVRISHAVRNIDCESANDQQVLRDAATLLRVLARVIDGTPLKRAMGAPGDWGYETDLGKGVLALHRASDTSTAAHGAQARSQSFDRTVAAAIVRETWAWAVHGLDDPRNRVTAPQAAPTEGDIETILVNVGTSFPHGVQVTSGGQQG